MGTNQSARFSVEILTLLLLTTKTECDQINVWTQTSVMNLLNRTLVSCAMSLRRLKRIFLFVVIIFTIFGFLKTFLLKSKENYSNNDELGDFLDKVCRRLLYVNFTYTPLKQR